jgi:hypothetical protein
MWETCHSLSNYRLLLTGNVNGYIYAAAAAEDDCMCRISRNQFGRQFQGSVISNVSIACRNEWLPPVDSSDV